MPTVQRWEVNGSHTSNYPQSSTLHVPLSHRPFLGASSSAGQTLAHRQPAQKPLSSKVSELLCQLWRAAWSWHSHSCISSCNVGLKRNLRHCPPRPSPHLGNRDETVEGTANTNKKQLYRIVHFTRAGTLSHAGQTSAPGWASEEEKCSQASCPPDLTGPNFGQVGKF